MGIVEIVKRKHDSRKGKSVWSRVGGALCLIGILTLVYLGLGALVWIADNRFNGIFMGWFQRTFMYTSSYENVNTGVQYIYEHPRYWEVKRYLIGFAEVALFGMTLIVYCAVAIIRARYQKRLMRTLGESIRIYMSGQQEASEVFPPDCAQIAVQMAELRSTMARHEQLLKEEAARKNDLITYLAHDLKTPLTSVIGYLSLLDEMPEMPQEQRTRYVHITLDKSLRLEKLINEFFDITRYNLQEIVLEKEPVDLSYLLLQMTDEFYPILSAHNNTIRLDVAEGLVLGADPLRLARVFNNLLKNAVAYSFPGTEITVTARNVTKQWNDAERPLLRASQTAQNPGQDWDWNWIRVTVSNKGRTIPPHKLEAIFEKFYRVDEARGTDTGGAGLGLAIAKEIVTLHGGWISAESDDGVTTFIVELPE